MASEAPFHVFTIDDERIEILAKELSNETGRKILVELSTGSKTASELARKLSLPMPTVLFHIERLVQAGLIEVEAVRAGSRGRVKIYTSSPKAILLITSRGEPREVLKKVYDHFIRSFDRLLRMPVLATTLLLVALTLFAGFSRYANLQVYPEKVAAPEKYGGERDLSQVSAQQAGYGLLEIAGACIISMLATLLAVKIAVRRANF